MKQTFGIENIKCAGCANSIRNAALQVEGVVSVDIDTDNQRIELETELPETVPVVLEKLSKLGYPMAGQNNVLKIAKSYVSCALGRLDGAQND